MHGPSNTFEFLRFFEDAFHSFDPNTGRPCLQPGDVIVMDDCPFHHKEGGEILEDFLNELNIEFVYMPYYSPDFNPAEYVFGKIKTLMKYRLLDLTNANLIESLYNVINFLRWLNLHAQNILIYLMGNLHLRLTPVF